MGRNRTDPALASTPRTYSTYVPFPRQAVFHHIPPWGPKLFKGAIGGVDGGKTTACEQELIELCNRFPGGQSVAIRFRMEGEGEITLLQDLKRLLLPGGFAEWRDGFFVFPNRHHLYIMHGSDYEKLGSLEICAAYVQEAHETGLRLFQTLSARLRHPAGVVDGQPYYRLLFDARGVTEHHWINTEFIKKGWNVDDGEAARARVENPNYAYIRFQTKDNRGRGAWYENELRREHQNDPLWCKVYIDGEIGFDVEGQPVFGDSYDPTVHISPETLEPDDSLPILRSWDYGYRAPGVTWSQYTRAGRFVVLRELAPRNLTTEALIEQAAALQHAEFRGRSGSGYLDFCDRAGDSVESVSTERDIELVERAFNTYCTFRYANREYGLGILRRLMLLTTKVNGVLVPRFSVDPSCATVRSALGGAYHYPDKTQASLSQGPIKGGPYAAVVDTLRYAAQEVVEEDLASQGAMGTPPSDSPRTRRLRSDPEFHPLEKEVFFDIG